METKHFNCVIMNPPFTGNLHLQILQEALKHADNVVNLSPVRWLQDPLAEYKKHSDYIKFVDIRQKLSDLDVVEQTQASQLFGDQEGSVLNSDLGVYLLTKKGGYDTDFMRTNSIVEKVHQKNVEAIKTQMGILEYNGYDKSPFYWVGVPAILGGHTRGIRPESLTSYLIYKGINLDTGLNYFKTRRVLPGVYKEDRPFPGIAFTNEEEARNFINAQKTKFIVYLDISVRKDQNHQMSFMPFMGNVVNPRTGKKGYEGEWTDADFYKFFNLTPEEIKIVEETMKDYE